MKIDVTADYGTRLAATIEGPADAPALLLLHSLGCDHTMWAPQIAALRERFRVIAPDSRGHGASAAPDGAYTLELLGRDALAVLDHAGVASAHVCGISMGGLVAQFLGVHAPARIGRLVLANTAARIGGEAAWRDREAAVREHGMAAITEAVLQRFFGPAFRNAQPDIVARFRHLLLTSSAPGYAGCCAALRQADLTDQIERIRAPTLVIAGREDVSTPPDQARALAAAIGGAGLLILPAAHLSNVEQAAAFGEALVGHLQVSEVG